MYMCSHIGIKIDIDKFFYTVNRQNIFLIKFNYRIDILLNTLFDFYSRCKLQFTNCIILSVKHMHFLKNFIFLQIFYIKKKFFT